MEDTPDLSTRQTCAGTILSDRHILTTARCVSDEMFAPSFSTFYVHLGDTILGNDKDVNYNKTVLVTNITVHPDYVNDYPYYTNNIAILEMAETVSLDQYPNIKPACLPSQGADFSRFRADFTETTATVTGWGRNEKYIENYNFTKTSRTTSHSLPL